MRDIAVVGAGLAGFHATRHLEEKLSGRRRVRITVLNRSEQFVFTPLLPAVATGGLRPRHVTVSLDEALDDETRLVAESVASIDVENGRLETETDGVSFDYLLAATGSRRAPDAFRGADRLTGPDTLEDAISIRDRVFELTDDRDSPLHFAILGAPRAGVEWAGQLANRWNTRRPSSDLQVTLFESRGRILADHPRDISADVADRLRRLGVDIRTKRRVRAATPTSVELEDGTSISTDLTLHCAGRRGTDLIRHSTLETDDDGKIAVDPCLRVADRPAIFAAGDAARSPVDSSVTDDPQLARQQGTCAAQNLLATMSGRRPRPFEFDPRGHFITLGPDHTVLELGGVRLEGRPAWMAYRLYYLALIPRPLRNTDLIRDWLAGRTKRRPLAMPPGTDE